MYQVSVSLLGADSKALDVGEPERFGFREMWINGRDFYLNGTRIYLFACPFENALNGAAWATYDSARETMLRMRSFGVNFVYAHNYGCEPGTHISYAEVLRAADEMGMLFSLSMPHFDQYDWQARDADQTNGYAGHAEYYVRHVARNHPSVVAYAMSFNAAGYNGEKDPPLIDGIKDLRTPGWAMNGETRGLRAQAIVQRFDATRLIYHHGCGNMGEMIALNFYVNFTPIEELDDWFGHWSEKGRETALPVRERLPACLGLRHVPWLVRRRAELGQCRRSLGALRGTVERAVLRRRGSPHQRAGEAGPALGEPRVSPPAPAGTAGTIPSTSSA